MSISSASPIGIFDSGVGGLTVASSITHVLPRESILYFGDTAHLPYGDKSAVAVQYFARHITDFLLQRNCKAIVIACNSASSVAYETLDQQVPAPIILVNVIDPVIDQIGRQGKNWQRIGVIGTERTIATGTYEERIRNKYPGKEVVSVATPLLAPMIEAGFYNNTVSRKVIEQYLQDDRLQHLDALILACTHYPLIRPQIEEFYDNAIPVLEAGRQVAVHLKERLSQVDLLQHHAQGEHRFYVSDYTTSFEQTTQIFYGKKIKLEENNIWGQH